MAERKTMIQWKRRMWLHILLTCCLGGGALLVLNGVQAAQPGQRRPADVYPMTVEDAQHHKVLLKGRPKRIISLAPSVTEILFAIGAGDRVVADTSFCKYPAKAASLPKIGGYLDPDSERVVAYRPDLVIAARGTRNDILDHLRAIGLPLLIVDAGNFDGVSSSIKLIGRLVGTAEEANRVAARLDLRREAVRNKTARLSAVQRPGTLFLFSLDDLFSAGPGSHIDDMIRLAGGRNIAAGTRLAWPKLSMEAIVAANPQVILVIAGHGVKSGLTPRTALAALRAKSQWRSIAAVKNGRVAVLDDDAMTLPGPRLINGLEAVARTLHPELFSAGGRR